MRYRQRGLGLNVQRLLNAFLYSIAGLKTAYQHEPAFLIEVWLAALFIPIACYLPVGTLGQALLIGSILLVLIVELINSSIEAVVDRISSEWHELAKRAKDCGSAAVLISLINVLVIWGIVLSTLV